LGRLPPLILRNIKTKKKNKDIITDMKKMNLNIGINLELILLWALFFFGINQQLNKVKMTVKTKLNIIIL
jgi:hypothetical protein